MNKEWKIKWLTALRSGDYEQGLEKLLQGGNNTPVFCCLGVLCDLIEPYNREREIDSAYQPQWLSNYDDEMLPEYIMDIVDIGNPDPFIDLPNDDEQSNTLSILNDSGYSFDAIADLIEVQL